MGIPAVDHEPWHDDLLSRLCAGREPPVPVAEVAELLDAAANDTLSHADLVDVIVTEKGIVYPPFLENFPRVLRSDF